MPMFFCEEIHGKTLAFFYLVFLFAIPDIVGTKKIPRHIDKKYRYMRKVR